MGLWACLHCLVKPAAMNKRAQAVYRQECSREQALVFPQHESAKLTAYTSPKSLNTWSSLCLYHTCSCSLTKQYLIYQSLQELRDHIYLVLAAYLGTVVYHFKVMCAIWWSALMITEGDERRIVEGSYKNLHIIIFSYSHLLFCVVMY